VSGPSPRDWDKELAEIDKLIGKVPSGGATPARPAPAKDAPALPAPRAGRREQWGVWARVGLGVLFGAAVTQYPYAHECGFGLLWYSGVIGMILLTGGWSAVISWKRRMGLAHTVSLLIVLWGLGLAASVWLARSRFAGEPLQWFCP